MLASGDVFAGYVIERQLGRGGMGSVYLAKHPRLPRMTALKLLNQEMFFDKEIRARFEREADLVAQLDHPNIVTVYDRGLDNEQLWISMQYIDGVDAASVDPTALPPERAVQIVKETAGALDYAHHHGVLHRDVKPANILLARGGGGRGERVYLSDFGIARLRDDSGHLTQTGTFTATVAYASPEQLSGTKLDHRSDQYSLACTLHWLLTGKGPFPGTNPAAVIQGHLQGAPPVLSAARAGLPFALDAVLAKAMAKQPGDRFATCAEFAAAAHRAVTGQSASAIPVAGGTGPSIPTAGPQSVQPTMIRPGTTGAPYPTQQPPTGGPNQAAGPGYSTGFTNQPAPTMFNPGAMPSGPQRQFQSAPDQQSAPQQQFQSAPHQQSAPQQQFQATAQQQFPSAPPQQFSAAGPYGQQPAHPYGRAQGPRYGPPPTSSGSNTKVGLIVALVVAVVLLIGVVIVVINLASDAESRSASSTTSSTTSGAAAPITADSDAISAEFPGMVPASSSGDIGYHGASCWLASTTTPTPDKGEPDFGTYAAQWRCYKGNNNSDPYYRFYVYESAAQVQSVLRALPSTAAESSATAGGKPATNYTIIEDGAKMVTAFSGDPDRAQFLMYTDAFLADSSTELMTWWRSAPL
ncbi:serine/threonine-protein kinase [Nocardia callitridis]|uniref:non-specific serine/threonine protein kinase n=1 Tax=Nocardia callitridis TaxID=648753 RepID=A0ABP9JR93_9NOCA